VDVGTGAGFPGLPIAIMKDDIKVTLLDSLNKRINFLNTVINKLGLSNVTTIHSRAEDGARDKNLREKFDIATSRAVANMSVLSEFCLPYVKIGGNFIALKGPSVEQEINDSLNAIKVLGGELVNICEVNIEETDLRHNLVVIKKVKECSKAYPRKAGLITKNPLK
jgi:16S rRNA (guanine527-N7)-methyltransferase